MPLPMTAKLSSYRAKRDFGITTEPRGDAAVGPAAAGRFVIQKHDATRLHYDLRLEIDGVFKSWAVTRGPSLDPHEKRLAVEVEDHPLDYGDFEGTIPEGQYGGGTVMVWDRGTWAPEGMTAGDGLAGGDLKFTLQGKKLSGSWVLVRMKRDRSGGKRTNWLLIKHGDARAREGDGEGVLALDRSVASGRTMDEIAAGRGKVPAPFMTARSKLARAKPVERKAPKTSRGAAEGSWPAFIPPQLCTLVDRPPAGPQWAHEVKFDGYRLQLAVRRGTARLSTRKGLDWTAKFPAIAAAAAALPDSVLDGEVVALDAQGSPDFAALQAALAEGSTERLVFFAFDLLGAGDQDLRENPLAARKERLKALLEEAAADHAVLRYVDHFATGGAAVLEAACRISLEGIVSKRLDAPYRSGRSDDWTKAKCRGGHEVVVGGWTDTGGRFRSLLAGVHRDGHLVYVGRIGTGYGAAVLRRLMPALKAHAAEWSPFSGRDAPGRGDGLHWLKPDLVAEIQYAGWTEDGLVRQASFKGLRDDKPAAEVEAEAPARPDEVALRTPAPGSGPVPKAAADATVMGVVVTHPGKALWPEADGGGPVTKLDLARFFEAVGAWMMPHLRGRPCSLLRAPDGIGAAHFFQRHAGAGMSSLLDLIAVGDDDKPYLEVGRVEGLAALAQTGTIELHPGNGRPGEPDVPGRLVFDLDPGPGVMFDTVVEAARRIKDRLDELGLASFCKTTGGKGLHVVAPLARPRRGTGPDWAAAKAFARALCASVMADEPGTFVITSAKKARAGRIYLDYLRNDRLATAVAPLSPRARPGAPVCMPLAWTQVRRGLDPSRYTLRSVPGLLHGSRAWADYNEAEGPLERAVKRLGPVT